MQGIVGVNVSKHHVYVLACTSVHACAFVRAWSGQSIRVRMAEECTCLWWTTWASCWWESRQMIMVAIMVCNLPAAQYLKCNLYIHTEEEGACVLTRDRYVSLKRLSCAGSRVCVDCTVCIRKPFDTSCAWSTPQSIPFLQLLLLCLVRPLSLQSNPWPLPVSKSAAAVRSSACAGYEFCIRSPSLAVDKRQCQ